MFSATFAKRVTLLLLAASLLMGLGRVATLPPFDDFDETAHYSRIEATAFAPPDAKSYFLSTDVVDYARHGPMTPWWIRTQAIVPAYSDAVDSAKPIHLNLKSKIQEQGYKDFRGFFAEPGLAKDYTQLYRETPGRRSYAASSEGNWEYQHPALYYVVMGRILRLVSEAPLLERLLILRSLSFLMAFAGFALGLFATLKHFELRAHADARTVTALGAIYPFAMPVFFPEFARLGNDSLCLLLFSLVWALLLWHLRRPREGAVWVLLGVAMGYTWLAKAFMIPITCGILAFMVLNKPPDQNAPPKGKAARIFFRLQPALVAGAAAFAIGFWPYAPGHGDDTMGSIELANFLHGRGFLTGEGIPWAKLFLDPLFMLGSAVFNITDIKAVYAPMAFFVAAVLILCCVFAAWLAALPRDPRREEWLLLYPLLPLAGGLLVHSFLSVFAYRTVGTTPGHYLHVLAPVLALIFSAGFLNIARRRGGGTFCAALLAVSAISTIVTMAPRLALFTGCAWLSDNFVNLNIDWHGEACRPDVMYDRLALFSWPAAGLPLMTAAFMMLVAAAFMVLRQLKAAAKA